MALRPTDRSTERSGEVRALSLEQEQAIQRTICAKRPEQLKMDFVRWSRAAVMQLIKREYGIKPHVRSVGKYLARWGFTPQKPIKRACEQSPASAKRWLNTQYRSLAPKGQTPVALAVGGTRQKLIHDRHREQPGQGALDDHRRGLQP